MGMLRSAAVYMALLLGANAGLAGLAAGMAHADPAAAEALREGEMKKLNFHAEPREVSPLPVETPEGGEVLLADYAGKHVVLNFWATWCAPCRKEMPQLDALNREMGGEDFEVVTIATSRSPLPGVKRFFDEVGIESLPILLDESGAMARSMGVLGLPVTVILDPEGQEIARMQGEADWNSENARAVLGALMGWES